MEQIEDYDLVVHYRSKWNTNKTFTVVDTDATINRLN